MRRAAGGTPAGGLGGRGRARAPTARGRTQQHASPTKATPAPARQRCRPEHATAGDAGANTGHQTQAPRRGHLATRARNGWGRAGEHGTPDGSAHRHARPRPARMQREGRGRGGASTQGLGARGRTRGTRRQRAQGGEVATARGRGLGARGRTRGTRRQRAQGRLRWREQRGRQGRCLRWAGVLGRAQPRRWCPRPPPPPEPEPKPNPTGLNRQGRAPSGARLAAGLARRWGTPHKKGEEETPPNDSEKCC